MSLQTQIDQDLKEALLSGDKETASTLRVIKSSILYAEVDRGRRDVGLNDEEVIALLAKEAKKRKESSELYKKGGDLTRAEKEEKEKQLIEKYLPPSLSEQEISALVDSVMVSADSRDIGKIINLVRQKSLGSADGALIARLVKERLQQ